jgi:hypothetical protein
MVSSVTHKIEKCFPTDKIVQLGLSLTKTYLKSLPNIRITKPFKRLLFEGLAFGKPVELFYLSLLKVTERELQIEVHLLLVAWV